MRRVPKKATATRAPRPVNNGDTAPALTHAAIERFTVKEAVTAAQTAKATAVRDIIAHAPKRNIAALIDSLDAIMEGASPDDIAALRDAILAHPTARAPSTQISSYRTNGAPAAIRTATSCRARHTRSRSTDCRSSSSSCNSG